MPSLIIRLLAGCVVVVSAGVFSVQAQAEEVWTDDAVSQALDAYVTEKTDLDSVTPLERSGLDTYAVEGGGLSVSDSEDGEFMKEIELVEPVVVRPVAVQEVSPDVKDAYFARQSQYFVAPIEDKKHSFETGIERYTYTYQETVAGGKFMNTKGDYSGIFLDYAYRPDMTSEFIADCIDEFRVEARYAFADVDYNASGTSYSTLEDYVFEARGLVAKNFNIKGMATAVPYTGVGFRYLNNGLEKIPANATTYSGYNRESQYVYMPFGVDVKTRLNNGWAVAMNLEYDHLLAGEQQSHLEDQRTLAGVNPGYANLVNKQDEGFGLRGSVKVSKEINKKVDVFVEPFFRYWNIEDSEFKPYVINGVEQCGGGVCVGGIEPSNTTQEIGVKMGVGF